MIIKYFEKIKKRYKISIIKEIKKKNQLSIIFKNIKTLEKLKK